MNVYDAGRMADAMAVHGYAQTDRADDAEVTVLNTCHIREKAAEKLFSDLGRLRRRTGKRARKAGDGNPVVVVAGCVAQAEGAEIMRRAPWVDVVVGPQTYHRLPELVRRAQAGERGLLDIDFPLESKFDRLPEEGAGQGPAAFLTIQEGCDKFCSFCVVPYTRGAEHSRPVAAVVAEAERLVERGAREITLLGQNVNAYHGETPGGGAEWGLGRLIRALADLPGLARIRYTTSHPRDMDEDLIAAHGEVPALMPFLHLPVQSGCDKVLAAMGRRHTARDYVDLVERLRAARPEIALSSDFIVGHPGEDDAGFEATIALVRAVGFAQAYSFKYSPRPGTPAATAGNQVDDAEKANRLARLQDLLNAQQHEFNRRTVGQTVPVLFDRRGRKPGQLAGRTPAMQAVHTTCGDPESVLGEIRDVIVAAAHANSLAGELPDRPPPPATGAPRTPGAGRAIA